MDGSIYQKILEAYTDVDRTKRSKLLRIYLHIPSLPQLRALRVSLTELKNTLQCRKGK